LAFTNAADNCANGIQIEAGKPAEMPKVWANKRTTESYAKLWTGAEEGGGLGPSATIRSLWI